MENIKINFFVICKEVIMDKDSNSLSLISIFENITSKSIPITYPKFSIVVNFTVFKSTDLKCSIRVNNPSNEEILKSQEFSIKTNGENQKIQLLNHFINTPFNIEGIHLINLIINNDEVSSIPLTIKKN